MCQDRTGCDYGQSHQVLWIGYIFRKDGGKEERERRVQKQVKSVVRSGAVATNHSWIFFLYLFSLLFEFTHVLPLRVPERNKASRCHAKSLSYLLCEIFSVSSQSLNSQECFWGYPAFFHLTKPKSYAKKLLYSLQEWYSIWWGMFWAIVLWRPSDGCCWLDFWPTVMILEGGNPHVKSVLCLRFPRFQPPPGETFQATAQVCLNDPPWEVVFNFASSQR